MKTVAEMSRVRSPTRERILDEVERLIALKGVFGFTLRDVAEPLGVRVPAIYKHYASRDDVLIEVSRRFVSQLAEQFEIDAAAAPPAGMRRALDRMIEFKIAHPAYVRLALVDFATPGGGMDYVKLAAGGSFHENLSSGPLAAMHGRLRRLIRAGVANGDFRGVNHLDFYRLIYAWLLVRLVFPDDSLLTATPKAARVAALKRELSRIAFAYLAPARARRPM